MVCPSLLHQRINIADIDTARSATATSQRTSYDRRWCAVFEFSPWLTKADLVLCLSA
jgi:hypothetical protein